MAINLKNYLPQYIGTEVNDAAGKEISNEYWNTLWNKHQLQGDYNAETLFELISKLNQTVFHDGDGAVSIAKHALNDGDVISAENVSAQIDYIFERLLPLYALAKANGAEFLRNENFETPDDCPLPLETVAQQIAYLYDGLRVLYDSFPAEHADLPGRGDADAHPMSAITGLIETLFAIQSGLAEAYPHNLFPGRNALNAHSIDAITGLSESLAVLNKHLSTTDKTVHFAQTISGKDSSGTWRDLQTILNNIYMLLKAATGFTALSHNDLLGKNSGDAHDLTAISGLETALSLRYTKAESDAKYQPKILYGTEAPSGMHPDGTIYLRIR